MAALDTGWSPKLQDGRFNMKLHRNPASRSSTNAPAPRSSCRRSHNGGHRHAPLRADHCAPQRALGRLRCWRARSARLSSCCDSADLDAFLGVTPRSNPRYNDASCYALERSHLAGDLLDRGTRLSPPVSVRSAFPRARQSLWQRLISYLFLASLITSWLLALSL